MAHSGAAPDVPASEWGTERLDLAAYLHRIGYAQPLYASAQTLRGLHRAHVATIAFENLDVVLGRGVAVDLESVQAKLVQRLRGGYCFEHNLLFAAVLERAGFAVTRLAGRVRRGSAGRPRPRTHMLLHVRTGERAWLADVGFGGDGLLEPMPLAAGTAMTQGDWTYRLDHGLPPGGDDWLLRSLQGDGWSDLYSFTTEPQHYVDYVMANHFIATHPDSPFVGKPVVQRSGPHARDLLVGRCFTRTHSDGHCERRRLAGDELPEVLEHTFGIVLTPEEHLRLEAATGSESR